MKHNTLKRDDMTGEELYDFYLLCQKVRKNLQLTKEQAVYYNELAVLFINWSTTQKIISLINDKFYNYYGRSFLAFIYDENVISKKDFKDILEEGLFLRVIHDFNMDFFFEHPDADLSVETQVRKYFIKWAKTNLIDIYISTITEVAQQRYPRLNKYYLKQYVKMRKLSNYTLDLDSPDEDIFEVTGWGHRTLDNVRNAFDMNERVEENSVMVNSPEESVLDEEMKEILFNKISTFSLEEQMVLKLFFVSKLTFREIASTMGISKSKANKKYLDALAKLKASL